MFITLRLKSKNVKIVLSFLSSMSRFFNHITSSRSSGPTQRWTTPAKTNSSFLHVLMSPLNMTRLNSTYYYVLKPLNIKKPLTHYHFHLSPRANKMYSQDAAFQKHKNDIGCQELNNEQQNKSLILSGKCVFFFPPFFFF